MVRPARLIAALFVALLATEAAASGLLVPNDRGLPPLRITDHLVDVAIHDQVGLTTLTQTFHNDTERRLEGTYIFPLPEQADLTDFQMTFNGKMVEGEVLPAEEARQIYESIVRQAKDPGLIEFIGRRLLRMRVFPIEPNSDTTIKVSYQQVLRPISGMRGYHYPLRTAKTSGQAHGTVRFGVKLNSQEPIKNIWSPTHAVEIVRDGEFGAKIAYEASGGSLEEDFILLYSTDQSDFGLSVIANKPNDDDDGHFLLLLSPKQLWPEEDYQPQDVVFVVDTSGSMGGDKITQARESLKYCVQQLDERDRFSVVRFSTGFDVLFEEVAEASADNKAEAVRFIEKFKAAGGTNIADTLHHVAGMKPADAVGRPFVVVFVTDGQGNRTPDVILSSLESAVGEGSSVRIFPFGVGHDVNTNLLDRLANSYTGRPVYVQPGENLELVLGDFFATISQPVLTNLKLSLPGIGVTDRFPVTLGDLYHGQQLTIAGKFGDELIGPVKLTAMRRGKTVEYSWPGVAFRSSDSADYVAPIWAGRKIAWMLDEIREHGENDEMVKEIVGLSQAYGIQTPYTSWLVTPEGRPGMPRTMDVRRRDRLFSGRGLDDAVNRPPGGGGGGRGGGGFGGGGGGGGFGGGGGGNIFDDPDSPPNRPARGFRAGEEVLDLAEAERGATDSSGRAATTVARATAALRRLSSRDESRLNEQILAVRTINGVQYERIGPFLVDSSVDPDKREMVYVVFASEAYFDIVMAHPDLREAFAANRNVVVPIGEAHAIVVVDKKPEKNPQNEARIEVLEEFSPQMREQLGLDRSK